MTFLKSSLYGFSPSVVALLCLFILIGCSESSRNPVEPSVHAEFTAQNSQISGGNRETQRILWGFYRFTVDPENNSVGIVPMRSSEMHLNTVKFLEPNGKPGLVQLIGGLNWNPEKTVLDITVQLTHPFPDFPQFTGFDVRGILIARTGTGGFSDADLITPTDADFRLINADGYTRWWNPREFPGDDILSYTDGALGMKDSVFNFECTLNGYKYFSDSLDETDDITTQNLYDRGVFRAGSVNQRHYTISVPDFPSSLVFNYAIDASWAPPLVKPPASINDFPADANQPEPWAIKVAEIENTLYYDETGMKQGGEMSLSIYVYDWQNASPPPQGTINKVVVEWPGLFAPTEATFESDEGDYAVWQVTVEPLEDAFESNDPVEYMVWAESSDGAGYGGKLPPTIPLIASARFMADVGTTPPNTPPVIISGVSGNHLPKLELETYSVVATDLDNDPLAYLWDVAPHISNDPGNGDGTFVIDWSYFGIGEFTIECRVSDGNFPAVSANPLDVKVTNEPPQIISGIIGNPNPGIQTETYSVVATDLDGDPLEYIWNMDPYIIDDPGNGDGTIEIDWSKTNYGEFTIKCSVTDLNNPPVDAIPLEVTVYKAGGLSWVKQAGGIYADSGNGIAPLNDFSTVVTGSFRHIGNFGEGDDEIQILSMGEHDIFIARYDSEGTVVWAKQAGGFYSDEAKAVTTLSDDSIVITGYFQDAATFGYGEPGEVTLQSSGEADFFIARYFHDGNLMWAKKAGGENWVEGTGISVLSNDCVVVTGFFHGEVIFGEEEANETQFEAVGESDIFIAMYNPDGTLEWAKRIGGSEWDAGYAVTTLSDDSVAVTGYFQRNVTFGQGEPNQTQLVSSSGGFVFVYYRDIFVARYNPDGTLQWAKKAGEKGYDEGYGITALTDDSIVITGVFRETAIFGRLEPNQTELTSSGGSDIFIAKYNPNGTLAWAIQVIGASQDIGFGITSLSDNSCVVTGYFSGTAIFDEGGVNETQLVSNGGRDIFVARYNSDGSVLWAVNAGGTGSDEGYAVATHIDDSIVATGFFRTTSTFGLNEPNQAQLVSFGGSDIFIARFLP